MIDISASACTLIVLAIPLGIVTIWQHFANKGAGAFFFQVRPGKNGKIFRFVKFKIINDERGGGKLLSDEQYMTKSRREVRTTSFV